MAIDKATLAQLRKYASAFRDARERGANEADTVLFLTEFFKEVLGYDPLKGEISKEHAVKDRYCDLALKIEGQVHILVECKQAGLKALREKDIGQCEHYGAHAGVRWALLTNSIEWQLYHLSFEESEGISHDLAFEVNFLEQLESDPDGLWDKLSLMSRSSVQSGALDEFWEHKKALSPASVIRAIFSYDGLTGIRKELNKSAPARLDIDDVFKAVRDVLAREAILEAGDITPPKPKKKKKKKVSKVDVTTGQTVEEEVEEDDDESAVAGSIQPQQAGQKPCSGAVS